MAARSEPERPVKRARTEVQLTLYDLFKRSKAKAAASQPEPAAVPAPEAPVEPKAQVTVAAETNPAHAVPPNSESTPVAAPASPKPAPASLEVENSLIPHGELLPYESFDEIRVFLELKQRFYAPNPDCLTRHPEIKPRMRSVLMDWLIEVSDEFTLHRETYHTASNLVDRYLSAASGCRKSEVQLIGVTCLFLAAKTLEIHAPGIAQFAELTDGACTAGDILRQEVKIMQALQWRITPPTLPSWVVALILSPHFKHKSRQLYLFTVSMEILDLASLDLAMLHHAPAHLAAAAIAIVARDPNVFAAIGFPSADIRPAIDFLYPYANVVSRELSTYKTNTNHLQQLHNVSLERFDRGHKPESSSQYSTPPSMARPARPPPAPRKPRAADS